MDEEEDRAPLRWRLGEKRGGGPLQRWVKGRREEVGREPGDGMELVSAGRLAPHPDEGAGWTLASAELNGAGPTRGRAEQDTFPNYLAPTSHFLVGHYSKSTLQSAVSASASHHGRLAHTHTHTHIHAQAAEPWTHCHLRVKLTGVEEGSVQNRAETDFCFTWR